MSTWISTITNKGIALNNKIVAGEKVRLTRAHTGSGRVVITDLKEQTELTGPVQAVSMHEPIKQNDNTFVIPVILDNAELTREYSLYQLGIFAEDPDEGEILYAISQAEPPETIPSAMDTPYFNIEWRLKFQNSNDANFEVYTDPQGYITRGEAEALIKEETEKLQSSKENSGEFIFLNDSANLPLVAMNVYGKTTQDGTPTPDEPVELVNVTDPTIEVCGKNQFPNSLTFDGSGIAAVRCTVALEDDEFVFTATDADCYFGYTEEVGISWAKHYGKIYPVKAGQYITISMSNSAFSKVFMTCFDKNKVILNRYEYSSNVVSVCPTDKHGECAYVGFRVGIADSVSGTEYRTRIQVEYAEAATEYERYEAQSVTVSTKYFGLLGIPVASGGNHIDEAGQQWVCDEIDMIRGVRIRRIGILYLEQISAWNKGTEWANPYAFFCGSIINDAVPVPDYITVANLMCNRLISKSPNTIANGITGTIGQGAGTGLYVSIDGIETAADLIAYFKENETVLYYVLAEPRETALTDEEIAAIGELKTRRPQTTITNSEAADMYVQYIPEAYDKALSGVVFRPELHAELQAHTVRVYNGGMTSVETDEVYNSLHTQCTKDYTHYQAIVDHKIKHPILGGGYYLVDGYYINSNYGTQKATDNDSNGTKVFTRALYNGTWTKWVRDFSETSKPTSSYVGNGSATLRQIDTGGIGNTLVIWDSTEAVECIVTKNGAICKNDTTITGVNKSTAFFEDGVLNILTTDALFNANGKTYYYQVL